MYDATWTGIGNKWLVYCQASDKDLVPITIERDQQAAKVSAATLNARDAIHRLSRDFLDANLANHPLSSLTDVTALRERLTNASSTLYLLQHAIEDRDKHYLLSDESLAATAAT